MRRLVPLFIPLFIPLLPTVACDHDHHDHATSGATCPSDNTLTYESFGRDFFDSYCTRCHSSELSGDLRLDAPVGYDFDTLAGIRAHLEHIDMVSAAGPSATNTAMPETNPIPTLEERTQLGRWLACGAP